MKLNYQKERWEKIPDEVRELHTQELDLTDHSDRELHKLEFDRRLYIMSSFLSDYTWDGTHRDDIGSRSKVTSNVARVEEEEESQSDLEAFIQEA